MRPADLELVVRKVNLDYLAALRENRIWHRSGVVFTHFLNGLQALFPQGEHFFIRAAREGIEQLKQQGRLDPQLAEDYELFVRQEGSHSRQHAMWSAALAQVGYPRMPEYDERMRLLNQWFDRHLSLRTRLAIVAASEHYTACLSRLMIYTTSDLFWDMTPPFQDLLLYHVMEEVEHKAVCFDIYQKCSGSYPRRLVGLFLGTLAIWVNAYSCNHYLLRVDGKLDREHRHDQRRLFFGPHGIFRVLWPLVRAYLRPSFHPWQWDERALLEGKFGGIRANLGIEPFRYRQPRP